MIILCNGMPRSASTWSYNVCLRLLSFEFAACSIYAGYNEEFLGCVHQLGANYRHLLLKTHTLDDVSRRMLQLGACRAIYTYRDPFDAIASYMRMFNQPFEAALPAIRHSFDLYKLHEQSGSCIVSYASVVHSPLEAVRRVKGYLGLNASEGLLVRIADETGLAAMKNIADKLETAPPESFDGVDSLLYDRSTLLHKNHIRDGSSGYGRGMLSTGQQGIIEETFPEWILRAR